LKAEPTSVAIETLKELGTCSNVIVFTDRDSRYYELTLKWLNKHAIPIQAFVVGPVEADITLTDFTKINPTVLCDLSLQKQYIKKTSADSADFPQNFYPGRLTEGIQTNVYGDQPNYTGLSDMVNVDYYDPHKIESVNLLEDHITVHDWWRTVQLGQPFRFDAATVKELHDSIVRELDSRGLPPHMSPIMSKADGYSLAPGGIVGVNNMGGGEAPRQDLSFKEPSPMQYGHVPEKKEDGFFFPGHRKDPKTGKILKPDRPPVNPMRKEDTWNIRFLGTAGSQETDNRHNSSIIFQDNGSDVLVDLGSINLIDKLMTKFAGAVVTHAHPDHTAGLPCLDPAVPIYMHRETWRDLLQHLPEIADKLEAHEIILVDTQNPITIGTCQFTWLPIEHHEEFNTYAILIQDCVLYSPDFSSLSDDYLKGIGTWIVDGNLLLTDEDPQAPATPVVPIDAPKLNSGHQSVLSSLKQAQRAQVPRVVVTHFSVQNDQLSPENMPTLIANLALQAGYTGDVLAARDGFVLPGGSV
jgi:phosphoribosyl 1,2-cyclic phosphodiesterase